MRGSRLTVSQFVVQDPGQYFDILHTLASLFPLKYHYKLHSRIVPAINRPADLLTWEETWEMFCQKISIIISRDEMFREAKRQYFAFCWTNSINFLYFALDTTQWQQLTDLSSGLTWAARPRSPAGRPGASCPPSRPSSARSWEEIRMSWRSNVLIWTSSSPHLSRQKTRNKKIYHGELWGDSHWWNSFIF